MKTKILSIALLFVMLTTIFVPINAFASETTDTMTLKAGTYRFNDVLIVPEQYIEQNIIFTSNNWSFIGIAIGNEGSLQITYLAELIEEETPAYDGSTDEGWLGSAYGIDNEQLQTHTITADTEVDDTFGTWYIANTNYNEVNGSNSSNTNGTIDILGYRTFNSSLTFSGVPTHSTLDEAVAQAEVPENCIKVKFPTLTDTQTYYLYPFYFYNIDDIDSGTYYDCYCVFVWATDGTNTSSPKDFYINGHCNDEDYDNYWVYGYSNVTNFVLLEQPNSTNTTWVQSNSTANNNYYTPAYPTTWDKDTYKYAVMFRDVETDTTYFFAYDKKLTANTDKSVFLIGSTFGVKYVFDTDTATWGPPVYPTVEENDTVTFTTPLSLVWSNYTIYYEDGTSFFPLTPTIPLTEKMMSGVLTEVLTILPIGLLCGIGYLGLRKGLKILAQLLLQA